MCLFTQLLAAVVHAMQIHFIKLLVSICKDILKTRQCVCDSFMCTKRLSALFFCFFARSLFNVRGIFTKTKSEVKIIALISRVYVFRPAAIGLTRFKCMFRDLFSELA